MSDRTIAPHRRPTFHGAPGYATMIKPDGTVHVLSFQGWVPARSDGLGSSRAVIYDRCSSTRERIIRAMRERGGHRLGWGAPSAQQLITEARARLREAAIRRDLLALLEEPELDCLGHEPDPGSDLPMGISVYCDGSCRGPWPRTLKR